MSRQPYYAKQGARPLPGADAYYGKTLSLPMYVGLEDRDIDEIADEIAEFPEVRYLVMGTGSCSLHAEIYVEVSSAIFDLVNRRIKRVPGVGTIQIFFHERVHTIRPILEG